MSLETLNQQVIEWAEDRGIFEKATPAAQYEKHVEEVGELGRALIECDQAKMEDAIGDIIVTLIILADMQGTSIEACLQGAYDVIAKRKGSMVDGVFVREK
jgi:NTP pyrophosphatase (non-canonical NTP hydrolase)